MRKIIITLLVMILLPSLVLAGDFFPEANVDLEAELFWTNIYFKPNTNTAIMNFRVWFKQPSALVWKTLTDTARFEGDMNNYTRARTLSEVLYKKIVSAESQTFQEVEVIIGANKLTSNHNRIANKNWTDYVYFRFNFPWPLTDRWAVHKIKCDETNFAQNEYKFEYKMTLGNFKGLSGYWHLVPIPGHAGWTEFRGRYESDAGIEVPKFVTKNAMRAGLKKDVEEYRKIMEN